MNMQIKNNFITNDETLVIFKWCFIEFQSHPPDPNGALWLPKKNLHELFSTLRVSTTEKELRSGNIG